MQDKNTIVRHHLLEIILWPNSDGTFRTIHNSAARLQELGIYNDFKMTIRMTHSEHSKLHNNNRSNEWKSRIKTGCKGRKISEETKEKLRLANIKRLQDPKERAKCAAPQPGELNGMYGHKYTEEERKKISEGVRRALSNREVRRKMSEAAKGENNPMYGKDAWAIACSRKTPEQIEAIRKSKSEKMKEYHKRRREGGV